MWLNDRQPETNYANRKITVIVNKLMLVSILGPSEQLLQIVCPLHVVVVVVGHIIFVWEELCLKFSPNKYIRCAYNSVSIDKFFKALVAGGFVKSASKTDFVISPTNLILFYNSLKSYLL